MTERALTATYRLQLHGEFPLERAREIVPYLERLGISHIYTSPVAMARPGSTHGYDVADPTRLNPELGTEHDRTALVAALHEARMGWVLDIVPNHVGTGASNPFWEDLLARGRASRWADWFDVDWEDRPERLRGRLLIPVLGDTLDAVLERGELRVVRRGERWRLSYFENGFPLSEESAELLADLATEGENGEGGRSRGAGDAEPGVALPAARMRELLDRQHYVLAHWRRAAGEINYRRFFDVNELAGLRVEDPRVFEETHALALRWVEEGALDGLRIDHIDGLADPRGYLERLRAAVDARTAPRGRGDAFPIYVEKILSPGERLRDDWPVQGTTGYEVLNDIESVLVDAEGLDRIESHYRRLLRLRHEMVTFAEVARRGKLYILRGALRADVLRLARQLAPVARRDPRAARLPREALVEAITELVAALPVYRTYIDGRTPEPHPDDRRWLERAFAAARRRGAAPAPALDLLERVLLAPPRGGGEDEARLRWIRRFQQTTGPAMAKGVEDTALYLYVPLLSRNEVGGEPDRALGDAVTDFHRANAERAARWPGALVATTTHDTKRSGDVRARLDVLAEIPEEWAAHVLRWRKLNRRHRRKVSGRLEPDANTEYLLYQSLLGIWPLGGLSSGSAGAPPRNHDGGEGAAASHRSDAHRTGESRGERAGVGAPPEHHDGDAGTESPHPSDAERSPTTPGEPAESLLPSEERRRLRERLEHYILKAAREGKMRTSWTDRNDAFENAVVSFLHAILDPGESAPFLDDLGRFARRIARPGLWNALSRTLLHLTVPGTPDLYQGDELWSFTLVDPDNRRPVDYALRSRLLGDLEAGADPAALLARPDDGRIKLLVTSRILGARRADPALWSRGDYLPLQAEGSGGAGPHIVSFARRHEERAAIVVAPRLPLALDPTGAPPVGERVWGDAHIPLPPELRGRRWRCALTGLEIPASSAGDALRVAPVLGILPVALLVAAGTSRDG